jgi:hypothetical protein
LIPIAPTNNISGRTAFTPFGRVHSIGIKTAVRVAWKVTTAKPDQQARLLMPFAWTPHRANGRIHDQRAYSQKANKMAQIAIVSRRARRNI